MSRKNNKIIAAPAINMNYHRICYRTWRYYLFHTGLPFDFSPENDIDDQARRYDILLTRTSELDGNGQLLRGVLKHIVGEFKNCHIQVTYHEFLQAQFYAQSEQFRINLDPKEKGAGVTGLLLCSGISDQFKQLLEKIQLKLVDMGKGIYNVIGIPGIDDFRIAVLQELEGDEYVCFRVIREGA